MSKLEKGLLWLAIATLFLWLGIIQLSPSQPAVVPPTPNPTPTTTATATFTATATRTPRPTATPVIECGDLVTYRDKATTADIVEGSLRRAVEELGLCRHQISLIIYDGDGIPSAVDPTKPAALTESLCSLRQPAIRSIVYVAVGKQEYNYMPRQDFGDGFVVPGREFAMGWAATLNTLHELYHVRQNAANCPVSNPRLEYAAETWAQEHLYDFGQIIIYE